MNDKLVKSDELSGEVTYGSVTLRHRDGEPLRAGEIPEHSIIEFDRLTGEVISIRPRRHAAKE